MTDKTYNLDSTSAAITTTGKADLSFDYTYDLNKNVESETADGMVMDDYNWNAGFDDADPYCQIII